MKLTILFFFYFITANSIGQDIKNYSGAFEKGTATYQYYENENFERIFHGNFTYKENSFSVYTLTGQFNHNLRNGKWKATKSGKDYFTNISTIETVIATYKNGNLDGLCTYSKIDAISKKELAKSKILFKNNIPIGNYIFIRNENQTNFSINIPLNNNGYADSTAIIKYKEYGKNYEDIRKYKNGFLYWRLFRDMSNGSIIVKKDRSKLLNNMVNCYDSSYKSSIIPLISFEYKIDEAPYLLSEYNEYIRSFDHLHHVESDSAYYINTPFVFFDTKLHGQYGSNWSLYEGINFWENGNCGYCGTRENPLYRVGNGANIVRFYIEKEIAINDSLLIKLRNNKTNDSSN